MCMCTRTHNKLFHKPCRAFSVLRLLQHQLRMAQQAHAVGKGFCILFGVHVPGCAAGGACPGVHHGKVREAAGNAEGRHLHQHLSLSRLMHVTACLAAVTLHCDGPNALPSDIASEIVERRPECSGCRRADHMTCGKGFCTRSCRGRCLAAANRGDQHSSRLLAQHCK